jgi:uncharacterized protein
MEIKRKFTYLLKTRLNEKPKFIQVVLGARQVGKTTGVLQILKNWKGSSLYISSDTEVNPSTEWIKTQWINAKLGKSPRLLIIDEIQNVQGWSNIIKSLWDEDKKASSLMHVVLLGSSSLDLHLGLNESLAGRFELTKVFHWSYQESKEAFGLDLETYLQFGGYPAPMELMPDVQRFQEYMLHSIIDPVLNKDILAHQRLAKPALLKQLFELFMEYPAQVISYQKLIGQLQERGNASTAKNYAELLKKAFLVYLVPKYSTRPLTVRTSSPKIISLAPALIYAVGKKDLSNSNWKGRIFENAILAALATSGIDLFYWNEGSAEVDAVVKINGVSLALEIKSTRSLKVSGLKSFQKKFPGVKTLAIDYDLGRAILEASDTREFLEKLI